MIDKKTRKKLKQIKKEISQLQKQIKKIEFRPCHNDAELKQKDEDIKALREKVYQLEKKHDISEDDYHRYHKEIQELTDDSIKELDGVLDAKEKEILEF